MGKMDLHEKFVNALESSITKRAVLVARISDILKIERESVNRRLSGKVQFTIREMGILARTLGMSIDELVYDDIPSLSELLIMENPGTSLLLEHKAVENLKAYCNMLQMVSSQPYSEYGAIISSLPFQTYIYYPNLTKFSCFKWAHYMHSLKGYYKEYQIPETLGKQLEILRESFHEMKYSFYIWNYSVMLGVVNDIHYFQKIKLLDQEDVEPIKVELNFILSNLEASFMAGGDTLIPDQRKVEHYVSSVDFEVSALYIWSEEYYHSEIFTFFMHSGIFSDPQKCLKMRSWINSMKKVSTLISGSGEMARISFLKRQYQYLSNL